MCQSSNDVYPTVQSIVLYRQIGEALESVQLLEDALGDKAKEFKNIVRLGRTCLQDAVPNTFGQVFGGWQHMIHRLKNRLADYRDEYTSVVLGATVLGTGMGQMPGYSEHIMDNLSQVLGWKVQWPSWEEEVIQDSAAFDGMQNCDHSLVLAGLLKALCCAAGRISKRSLHSFIRSETRFRRNQSSPKSKRGLLIGASADVRNYAAVHCY